VAILIGSLDIGSIAEAAPCGGSAGAEGTAQRTAQRDVEPVLLGSTGCSPDTIRSPDLSAPTGSCINRSCINLPDCGSLMAGITSLGVSSALMT
jgi:hypothetical protein